MSSWFNWGGWNFGGTVNDQQPSKAGTAPDLSVLSQHRSEQPVGSGRAPPASMPNLAEVQAFGTMPRTVLKDVQGSTAFAVGEVVEYYSSSSQSWIPAKVIGVNPGGTYSLDCKPDVRPDKIRRRSSRSHAKSSIGDSSNANEYTVGEIVEYKSASQGKWIPARVAAVKPGGSYDLDCKPDVAFDKIRKSGSGGAGSGAGTGTGTVSGRAGTPAKTSPTPLGSGALSSLAPSQTSQLSPPPTQLITRFARQQTEPDAPVQLLRVHRNGSKWRYEVCLEGLEMLERHGSRRIAVASICGLYRTGKSYLLNLLLERVQKRKQLFQVGATTRACTEGIWLWGSSGGHDDDRSPLLAFLDCEGFGSTDSDQPRDAQLMALCSLLSSVLVMNTRGALNEGLFSSLALSCRFAEHMEEVGSETNRPTLLWVLRDFMLELQDSQGRSLTPDEYLDQALQASPAMGFDQERSQAAQDARQGLMRFFKHRNCITLVQPAVEESELQDLSTLPYSALRGEFRAGIEALRAQIVAACHAAPKAVGGEPIGCRSFAALFRQLVESLNGNRSLSIRTSWEAVQHNTCSQLSDQLRVEGTQVLKELAAGQALQPGGERLPMPDEALRELLRSKRHELKARWEEAAVGDNAVRKEYWQELKESLAREELTVRQQNGRLAEQRLTEALKEWQAWLDDEDGDSFEGEQLAARLGKLMDEMPALPLARANRSAMEAAARQITAARATIAATQEHFEETRKQADNFGAKASRQEGAARSELEARTAELREAQERLRRLQQEAGAEQVDLQTKTAELMDAKAQLQATQEDIEDARQREQELRSQHRLTNEREVALKTELDEARAAVSKAESERMASENRAKAAAEAAASEIARLQKQVEDARVEVSAAKERLASEKEVMEVQAKRHSEEHKARVEEVRTRVASEKSVLVDEHTKQRDGHQQKIDEVQRKLEEERSRHEASLDSEQSRLLERERQGGILEGQVTAHLDETIALKQRLADLQLRLSQAEAKAGQAQYEGERLQSDLNKATYEAESAKAEVETYQRRFSEEKARLSEDTLAATMKRRTFGSRSGSAFGTLRSSSSSLGRPMASLRSGGSGSMMRSERSEGDAARAAAAAAGGGGGGGGGGSEGDRYRDDGSSSSRAPRRRNSFGCAAFRRRRLSESDSP
mmetsp:Transcript_27105/g.57544  ORF Transcript_27105/g.57544 Transcript_27105/m.57544 type:complete len:1166 (+) Transcript_27105:67-3564(+)